MARAQANRARKRGQAAENNAVTRSAPEYIVQSKSFVDIGNVILSTISLERPSIVKKPWA